MAPPAFRRAAVVAALGAALLAACTNPPAPSSTPSDGIDRTYLDASLPVADRVDNLLGQMTLEEKIGQMTQIEEGSLASRDVSTLHLGSVLHGGGQPSPGADVLVWRGVVEARQRDAVENTRLGIPILYGIDAIHGFGSMSGATVFPQQIGLGATRDADLVRRIGEETASEVSATGIRWSFSPVLAIPGDIRWGRTYEAFSQDPALVATLGAAYVEGLQSPGLDNPRSVLATAKHYIGDGSTTYNDTGRPGAGYMLDQGVAPDDEGLLRSTLMPPYQAAIDAGAESVMASFSSWGSTKVHADGYLLTTVLRGDLGFGGFVVSDWGGCNQINPSDYDDAIAQCINAGVDMVMVPNDGPAFQNALRNGLAAGTITESRIDEAVSRILAVKFDMGLFDASPYPDAAWAGDVGTAAHRALAREAVQKSLVLLQNRDTALPIRPTDSTIVVVGNAADDMHRQAGGWTTSWQGDSGPPISGTTILDGIVARAGAGVTVSDALPSSGRADVCVAVVGEPAYAEGFGDSADLVLPGLDVIEPLANACDRTVLVVVSGRPVMITDALSKVDAVVAAWQPGSAGEGVADALFGDVPFTGRLPMNWPRDLGQVPDLAPGDSYLFPMGFGLTV